jgi:hypothetical protein
VFADPGVDFGERSSGFRPIKGVFRFRHQFDGFFAFIDRILFQTQARQNSAELPVTSRIAGSLTYELLGYRSRLFERGLRPDSVALI